MTENYTIIDCYTDEPSGLGVPPYLGTFPRYIYGALKAKGIEARYLTIDDIRLLKKYNRKRPDKKKEVKTNIKIYNLTNNTEEVEKILNETTELIIIAARRDNILHKRAEMQESSYRNSCNRRLSVAGRKDARAF
jgi:radical SAM superfamily enzyme with C-terminal helix-hairpin-helix motif